MFFSGMKFRKIIRIGISGILLSLFLSASSSSRDVYQPPDSQGDTFRIRNFDTTFLSRFDPAKGESVFVSQQIFDGLVRLDNDLNIVPDLAEYWDISEGGRCYTFYLRKGVRFHDGRELTAGDVEFSLRRLMDPETESPFGRLFVDKVVGGEEFAAGAADDVAGFRILDRYIFELHWKKPYVSALGLLSMSFCRILPRETVEEDGSRFFARPVGTGPFKFDGWIRSPRLDIVGVRLARNPSYFGRLPRVAMVEYSPYYTHDHFEKREIDAMPFSADLARLGCRVVEGGDLNVYHLMMSCANPPFDRARIRRAMALVIDRERLTQVQSSGAVRFRASYNFIPDKLPGFLPSINPVGPAPDEAYRILEEEGYFHTKEFPEILLYLPAGGKIDRAPFVRELTRQFETVGIRLKARDYWKLGDLADVRKPFFVLCQSSLDFPDPESVIQPLFGRSSPARWLTAGVPGPEFDVLLEEAAVESGRARYQDLFREMERMIRRDVPGIPLFAAVQRLAVQPNVRGVRIPILGTTYLDLRDVAFIR